jgi:molybdate transport system permease protein
VRSRAPYNSAIVGLGAVGAAFFVLPLVGLLARAPWRHAASHLRTAGLGDALRLSVECSLAATALSLLLGVPLALLLARGRFPGRALLRGVTLLPMVLPPVVGGVALLFAFGRRGLFGLHLAFTTAGVVMAETFVAMPFLVVTVEAALRNLDPRFEDAARSLGAGRWTVLRRVTLPMIGPSLAAGAVLCWARALGEFGATITFAGNLRGATQTMPLAVYLELQHDPEAAVMLSLVLLAAALGVLVGLRGRWLRPS